ncbi:hypothetical protein Landi51_03611 [Colletotrichum acutatum]
MAGNSWTAEAEKALLICIVTTANSGAGTKPDWANVARRMNRLGYSYTVAALSFLNSQRFSKSLIKPYNEHLEATADMPVTPALVPSSRKRAAPGSGTRVARTSIAGGSGAVQAANEMASLALSADDGVDDAEPDMEDSKKRVKISHGGLVAGLNGQHIDLTGNDTDANMENAASASGLNGQPVDLTGDLAGDHQVEIKLEGNGSIPSFTRAARSRRPRFGHPSTSNPELLLVFMWLSQLQQQGINSPARPASVCCLPLPLTLEFDPTTYSLPSITTFRLSIFPSSIPHTSISTTQGPTTLLLSIPTFQLSQDTQLLLQKPSPLSKMDLTKEFRSLTISEAAATEARFKTRGNFNAEELEKRVWIACVKGRQQLMAINARKAAEKEEAAAKAAAEAAEAANANAMVLD